eukprot:TRINITY_DN12747_c0_g1_i1.p1 TRINITY_DN12747_c0_g1~~TRINITY_DN12747_c0_g1_i1.p1  ORF type:complete len:318 (+),score=0.33 TRINITY_DN12747_c0_g1_i1:202-1155(+)
MGASMRLYRVVLLLLLSASASTVHGTICPLTGLAPVKPTGRLNRCVAEQDLACCNQCDDWTTAVGVISTNGTVIFDTLFPDGLTFPGLKKFEATPFCGFLAGGSPTCLQMIEGLYCAIMCDPSSATWLRVEKAPSGRINDSAGVVRICNDYAVQTFEQCKDLTFPGVSVTLGSLMPNPSAFINAVVGPLAGSATPLANLSIELVPAANGTGTCYLSPPGNKFNTQPLCCDDLNQFPMECVQGEYASFDYLLKYAVNRTLPVTCQGAGNTTAGGDGSSGGSGSEGSGQSGKSAASSFKIAAVGLYGAILWASIMLAGL